MSISIEHFKITCHMHTNRGDITLPHVITVILIQVKQTNFQLSTQVILTFAIHCKYSVTYSLRKSVWQQVLLKIQVCVLQFLSQFLPYHVPLL